MTASGGREAPKTSESAARHPAAPLPAAPARRLITPAPESYEQPPQARAFAWPLLWIGLAIALIVLLWGLWPVPGLHH